MAQSGTYIVLIPIFLVSVISFVTEIFLPRIFLKKIRCFLQESYLRSMYNTYVCSTTPAGLHGKRNPNYQMIPLTDSLCSVGTAVFLGGVNFRVILFCLLKNLKKQKEKLGMRKKQKREIHEQVLMLYQFLKLLYLHLYVQQYGGLKNLKKQREKIE